MSLQPITASQTFNSAVLNGLTKNTLPQALSPAFTRQEIARTAPNSIYQVGGKSGAVSGSTLINGMTRLVNNIVRNMLASFERMMGSMLALVTGGPSATSASPASAPPVNTPTVQPTTSSISNGTSPTTTLMEEPAHLISENVTAIFDSLEEIWNGGKSIFSAGKEMVESLGKEATGSIGGLLETVSEVGSMFGLGKVGSAISKGVSKVGKVFGF